jgi:lipid-A-disaccharide synthase
MTLVKHYKDTAVMGVINVLLKLRSIKKNLEDCKRDIAGWNPDLMLFIDYPGFNLRIAEYTHKLGIVNFFYIAPKVWASREKRVKKIEEFIHKVYAILPFEEAYFSKFAIPVEYVGNPVLDALNKRSCKNESRKAFGERLKLNERPIVALLAGSRQHEVSQILPYFLVIADKFPSYQYVIAGVPVLDSLVYEKHIGKRNIHLVFNETYAILQHAHVALVASGTATLETALLNVPQVVCYRFWGKHITQFVMDRIVKVPYVSLVNLILNSEVVPELIQKNLTHEKLEKAFVDLTENAQFRDQMLLNYKRLQKIVGKPGVSDLAAESIIMDYNCKKTRTKDSL